MIGGMSLFLSNAFNLFCLLRPLSQEVLFHRCTDKVTPDVLAFTIKELPS